MTQIADLVRQIQTQLGFTGHDVDGVMGPHTYAAIMAQQRTSALNTQVSGWDGMKIDPAHQAAAEAIGHLLLKNRARYEAVQVLTGVPWWFIAAIHQRESAIHVRESSVDFHTYLGNGEPLNRVTRLVPVGRGPFDSWEDGAVDALKLEGFVGLSGWDMSAAVARAEKYNGMGYAKRGLPSPYVWSWSDQYHSGKFVRDGVFDADTVDQQCGVAVIWKIFQQFGVLQT